MPGDHLPFAVATNVDFCESPIVTRVSTMRLTNSLQPTGDDGGVRRYASFRTFSSCSISFMSSGFAAFERKGQNNPKTIPDAQIKLLIRLVNFCMRHSLLRLIIVSINPKSGVNLTC